MQVLYVVKLPVETASVCVCVCVCVCACGGGGMENVN
jgi:hypothetical protein